MIPYSRVGLKFVVKPCLVLAVLFMLAAPVASAQSYTPVNGGKLYFTDNTNYGSCCGDDSCDQYYSTEEDDYSNFYYVDSSGNKTTFPGASTGYVSINSNGDGDGECYNNDPAPGPTGDDPLALNAGPFTIYFDPSDGEATYQANTGTYVDPQYKLLSILYAPPGNKSYAGYTSQTSEGDSSTIVNTFTQGTSVSFHWGGGLFSGVTYTLTYNWTFEQDDQTSFMETYTNTNAVKFNSSSDALDHTQDVLYLWLNPEVTIYNTNNTPTSYALGLWYYQSAPVSPPLPSQLLFSGISGAPVDICNVTISQLQNPNTIPAGLLSPQQIDGYWVPGLMSLCANPVAENQCTVAQAEANGCGCTAQDFAGIVQQDPFFSPQNTTLFPPEYPTPVQVNSFNTNRFAYISTLTLQPSIINTFQIQDAQTTGQTFTNKTSYNTSASFAVGSALPVGFKVGDQFTWTDSQSIGNTDGTTHTAQVSFGTTTSSCYEHIDIYEDTVFHTFVFAPDSDYNTLFSTDGCP